MNRVVYLTLAFAFGSLLAAPALAEPGMAGIGGMGGGLKGIGGMGGGFKGIGGMGGGFKGIGGMGGGCRGIGDAGGGWENVRQNYENNRYTRYGDSDPSAKFGQFGQSAFSNDNESSSAYGSRWNNDSAYQRTGPRGPLAAVLPLAVRQKELEMAADPNSSVNNPQYARSEYAARQLASDVGTVFRQMSSGLMSGFRGAPAGAAEQATPYHNLGLLGGEPAPNRMAPPIGPQFTGNPDSMGAFRMYTGE